MLSDILAQHAISVTGLSKSLHGCKVLDDISFSANEGEVIAVLGHNGAGKSTLVKCLTGMLTMDSGYIVRQNQTMQILSPLDARKLGIEAVHQNFGLIDELDVVSNFFLGRELHHDNLILKMLGWLDKRLMRFLTGRALERLGCEFRDLDRLVKHLSAGERQLIAVARAIHFGAQVVVMDEPSSALGMSQMAQLQEVIRTISAQGVTVLLVSHDMPFIREVCDRAMVLSKGRLVANINIACTSEEELYSYMMGCGHIKEPDNSLNALLRAS